MRIILVLAALLLINAAYANPLPSSDEIIQPFSDRGFLSRIGDVGEKVEAKASELVDNAMTFLGVRYKRGGTSSDTGFDCSGFVRAIFEQSAGLVLPRSANQQAAASEKIDRADLQPGDLVFFNTMRRAFSHVGIYVGDGNFIHSPKSGANVRVESLSLGYWARRFDGARRVPADAAASSKP
ncbi:MAG: C40 family peptidase [Burkholderiales bacterium]